MSLAVRLQRTGAGTDNDYKLETDVLSISYDRAPIAAPIPGGEVILIDLGQWKITIVVEGKASFPGTNLLDGSIKIADKDDLEIIANPTVTNAWYDETITLTDDTDSSGTSYTVKIAGLKLEKRGANNFYTFRLQCVGFLN